MSEENTNPIAHAAFNAILGCLEGLTEDDALDVVASVAARVIMCAARGIGEALSLTEGIKQTIEGNIETNWHIIERERAGNGGRQPAHEDRKH